jgi:hypothetical protein
MQDFKIKKVSSSNLSAAARQLRTMMRRSTPQKDFVTLEDNTAEKKRYENISNTKNYYLTSRATEQSDERAVKRHKKGKHARSFSHSIVQDSNCNESTAYSTPVRLIDGMAEKRKAAIEYFYVNIYGSPDDIDSIVTPIMNDLYILRGNYNSVKDILQDLKQKTENPDVIGKKDGRGRKPLIEDFNDEAK